MKLRRLFHRQALVALFLCPFLYYSTKEVEFNQPKLFKAAEYQLTPQFFKFISSGFWPAAHDYLWIRTLQIIGTGNFSKDILLESIGFYRLSIALDPYFYEVYDQAAVNFSCLFDAAYPALEFLDKGIRVYEHGSPPEKFWRHPYSLYMYRAYIHAFMLNDWVHAKDDYLKASQMRGAPRYLQEMQKWLKEEGSESVLAVKVLKLMIRNTDDQKLKQKYQEKLRHYE
jgi:hypothetical protein